MSEGFMVYVSCMTYNHSVYIKDALDGFCMQQTSFPYVCGIIDDASTDGEQEVIRHYLKEHFELDDSTVVKRDETDDYTRIFAQHKENKNCYFAVVFLKYNHYSIRKNKIPYIAEWRDNARYVALCEGDDYWIYPRKLEEQVAFMENHPNHSLCICSFYRLYSDGRKEEVKRYTNEMEICPIKDIISGGGGYASTNSILFRMSLFVPYQTWALGCPIGDAPNVLTLAHKGHVCFLSKVMCVHRVASLGSWTSRMASSVEARKNHRLAMIRMWRQFDKWSNMDYHRYVSKRIRINQIHLVKDEITLLWKSLVRFFS